MIVTRILFRRGLCRNLCRGKSRRIKSIFKEKTCFESSPHLPPVHECEQKTGLEKEVDCLVFPCHTQKAATGTYRTRQPCLGDVLSPGHGDRVTAGQLPPVSIKAGPSCRHAAVVWRPGGSGRNQGQAVAITGVRCPLFGLGSEFCPSPH